MADVWDVAEIERLSPDEANTKAARKLLKEKRFSAISRRGDGRGWWARCRGTSGDYEVTATLPDGGAPGARCTCQSYKRPCKHAVALLLHLAAHPEERAGPDAESVATPAPGGDFEGLLAACFERPDSDTLRLVFADYLEESGDEARAHFVRLQLARALKKALPAAEAKLLAPLLAGLPEWAADGLTARRGFLTLRVGTWGESSARAWPEPLHRLFRLGWVERLEFWGQAATLTGGFRRTAGLVGALDFGDRVLGAHALRHVAALLRPGRGRLRSVKVSPADRAEWGRLAAHRA